MIANRVHLQAMRQRFPPPLILALCLVLLAAPARAVETLVLAVESLQGEGFSLTDLRAELRPGEGRHGLSLEIGQLRLGDELLLERVRLDCPALVLLGLGGTCERGSVRFEHPWLGPQSLTAAFTYVHPGVLSLELQGLRLAGGWAQLIVHLDGDRWQLRGRGDGLDLEGLSRLSGLAGHAWPVTATGSVAFRFDARGRGTLPDSATLQLDLADVDFASEDGLKAGEDLSLGLNLALRRERTDYRVELVARWHTGGVYVHPVFVEADAPLSLDLRGRIRPADRHLTVDSLRFEQPGVAVLSARGSWAAALGLAGLDATLDLESLRLPAAFDTYALPFLPGTALDALDSEGLLAGRVRLAQGQPVEAALQAVRLFAHDRMGRFALDGVDAALNWRADGTAPASRVAMDGGHVYGIALGAIRFQPQISRDGVRLPEPVHVPILDGALEIRGFEVAGLGSGATRWAFDGGLSPISMERLTQALGWPLLSGTLAGIIPDVRYEQGLLTVGGRLLVRAFDGTVTLGDLRLRDPLGVAPELSAQIQVRGLDLAELTRTFDVGRITGRLDGDIRDLVLVRWSPVYFDAVFRTPPGDTSPRRISQRAVDNLTRVGSGVGGALSGGFLRFFEDFSYRQLGLSCRLVGEVCTMDGVAPAPQGYYIVQGSGLPRIDVIGFTREVAWRDLVNRLSTVVLEGGGPVVR
ncbi:hypothetical protein [Thioalkalivibrio sulfidiphilus]|uniref:hypothetical protein n=1 Tax=Thioalkalivibrio sulfidiphilus TaxID=1033854 RepID=UPI000372F414|nr:hypothetical protein [Thioalkalivibrio sulfidiphilus]